MRVHITSDSNSRIRHNTKVYPMEGMTARDGLTYGYTRGEPYEIGEQGLHVDVYWPQVRQVGAWPIRELKVA